MGKQKNGIKSVGNSGKGWGASVCAFHDLGLIAIGCSQYGRAESCGPKAFGIHVRLGHAQGRTILINRDRGPEQGLAVPCYYSWRETVRWHR